jgi:hypothetical protein
VTDPDLPSIKQLKPPTQCVLWEKPELLEQGPFKERFEVVEGLVDESHDSRNVFKCRECGQLYFYEWHEEIDWEDGDDAQYTTYIPVQTREEIDELKAQDFFGILSYFPRLQRDKPTGKGTKLSWIGK